MHFVLEEGVVFITTPFLLCEWLVKQVGLFLEYHLVKGRA